MKYYAIIFAFFVGMLAYSSTNRTLESGPGAGLEIQTNGKNTRLTVESGGDLLMATGNELEFQAIQAAPLVYAGGDTDTGLVLDGADSVNLQAGGTDALQVSTGGVIMPGTLGVTGITTLSNDLNVTGEIDSSADTITVGTGAGVDQFFTFDIGGSNPGFRWDHSETKLQFTLDGAVYTDLGGGGGGTGTVVTNSATDEDEITTEYCLVNASSGTPTFDTDSALCDDWLSSITDNGTGNYSLVQVQVFSKNPICTATPRNTSARITTIATEVTTTSDINIRMYSSSGSATDDGFYVKCAGVK